MAFLKSVFTVEIRQEAGGRNNVNALFFSQFLCLLDAKPVEKDIICADETAEQLRKNDWNGRGNLTN